MTLSREAVEALKEELRIAGRFPTRTHAEQVLEALTAAWDALEEITATTQTLLADRDFLCNELKLLLDACWDADCNMEPLDGSHMDRAKGALKRFKSLAESQPTTGSE